MFSGRNPNIQNELGNSKDFLFSSSQRFRVFICWNEMNISTFVVQTNEQIICLFVCCCFGSPGKPLIYNYLFTYLECVCVKGGVMVIYLSVWACGGIKQLVHGSSLLLPCRSRGLNSPNLATNTFTHWWFHRPQTLFSYHNGSDSLSQNILK